MRENFDVLIFCSGLAIAIPLLVAWVQIRLWDLQREARGDADDE
jgi:hypothetical protein